MLVVPLQCEKLRAEAATLPGIRAELDSLRRRHSAALELMGERDEEVSLFFPFTELPRLTILFYLDAYESHDFKLNERQLEI